MRPRFVISGAAGRMGKRILSLALEIDQFDIIGAIERENHSDIGKDAGLIAGVAPIGVKLSATFPSDTDLVIDFSLPEAVNNTIDYCEKNGAAIVLGTTGLSTDQKTRIQKASEKIPVIYGTNMSVGMNILFSLVGRTASMLGQEYDIEIIEQHHRFKKDAPSGSALTLAENICEATGRKFPDCLIYERSSKNAPREKGSIGMHTVRAGDITGIHSILFSTLGETVTLNHTAHSRDGFARGALRAAQWLVGKNPGSYSMQQVLGLVDES